MPAPFGKASQHNSPFSFILIWQRSSSRSGTVHASVRAFGIFPPLVPLLPCWSIVIAAFETECLPRHLESATGRSSRSNAGFKGQQALAPAEAWKSGRADLEFRLHCSGEKVETRLSGTQRHDHVPNTSQWGQHRSGARFRNLQEVQKRGQWRAFSCAARLCLTCVCLHA